ALAYFQAAVVLYRRKENPSYIEQPLDRLPIHNSLNHAIELILKSYLLEKGMNEKNIHDLEELVADCERLDVDVSQQFKELAIGQSRIHEEHRMRYYGSRTSDEPGVFGHIYFSNPETMFSLIEKELERLASKVCP